MSTTHELAQNFMRKSIQSEKPIEEGFEKKKPLSIGIPLTIELTEQEKRAIQKILVDDYQPDTILENQVSEHVEQLTNITKEIKSISAQSILLHGERIKQAQDLLADYKEGAFTKWLMSTYGNRQTPYSMLRYYEFYQSAPKETQPLIESAPKKAIYLLASRDGDKNKKLELIQKHGTSPQANLLLLIQSTFPTEQTNKRKPLNISTIESIGKLCLKLESRKQYLKQDDMTEIKKLIKRLENLCTDS